MKFQVHRSICIEYQSRLKCHINRFGMPKHDLIKISYTYFKLNVLKFRPQMSLTLDLCFTFFISS